MSASGELGPGDKHVFSVASLRRYSCADFQVESWLTADAQLSRVVNAIADLASRMPVLQAVADAPQGEWEEILLSL